MPKKTSDLKKGDKVLLSYGDQNGDIASADTFKKTIALEFTGASYTPWWGEVMEKPRGKNPKRVMLMVHGFETEGGDVWAHQVIGWMNDETGTWEPIEHTDIQNKFKEEVEVMGF